MRTLARVSDPVVDTILSLIADFGVRVHAASPESWSNPSPCADWTARDVVVHVGDSLFRVAETLDDLGERKIADTDDIVTAWDEVVARFTAIVTVADLDKVIPNLFGPFPAREVLGRFMTTDVLIHTWDLSRAIGVDERLNPYAVSATYEALLPLDGILRNPGVFGPAVDAPADADEQTRLITFLGRKV